MLPDDILLEIFDCVRLATCQCAARPALKLDCDVCYYLQDYWGPLSTWSRWEWHRLTHVCRRWRSLVLASPYRLDLRLICAFKRRVRFMKKALASSPTIPIAVWYPKRNYLITERPLILEDENNAFIALQHPNRIREINLFLTNSLFLKTRAQLLASFPVLEHLLLESSPPLPSPPTISVGFLGGSAPRLRHIRLTGVAFPTLPLLLLSTRDLVTLRLESVSKTGYFSPEMLSIGLSMTTRLEYLLIQFSPSLASREIGSTRPPLAVRATLPALTKFHFSGDRAYLDDLISRIDSPIMERFFRSSALETRQHSHFTVHPSLHALADQSFLLWGDEIFSVNEFRSLLRTANNVVFYISSENIDPKATLPHIFTQHAAHLYWVQRVDMKSFHPNSPWLNPDKRDSAPWVDFFCHLLKVRVLEVAGVFVQIVESVLERLPEDMVQEVLPALKDLHIGKCQTPGPFEDFAVSRRLSGYPISVHYAEPQNSSDSLNE